uniref:Peptidase aspartic putative domain-containing protein n=1 Tax=Anopheles dirus TaxID=7168 RepID=A0A182NCC3_9DIPT
MENQQPSRRMQREEAATPETRYETERNGVPTGYNVSPFSPVTLREAGSPSEAITPRCIPATGGAIPSESVISKAGALSTDHESAKEGGTSRGTEKARLAREFRHLWTTIGSELRKLEGEEAREEVSAIAQPFRRDERDAVAEPEIEDRVRGVRTASSRREREDGRTWGQTPADVGHDLPQVSRWEHAAFAAHTPSRYATLPHYTTHWGSATQQHYSTTHITQSQAAARQGVPRDLPSFAGDVESWPLFIATYTRTTAACGYTDVENLVRLQHALKGIALETVGHLLSFPEGVKEVMATLEARFGRPDLIVESLIAKIRRMAAPKMEKLHTVVEFGFAVKRLIGAAQASGLRGYLYDVSLLRELVKSLPPVLCVDWARCRRELPQVTVMEFGRWIGDLADDLCRVIDMSNLPADDDQMHRKSQQQQQQNSLRSQSQRFQPHQPLRQYQPPQPFTGHRNDTGRVQPAYCNATMLREEHDGASETVTETFPVPCILCGGSCEALRNCPKFRNTTVAARRAFVAERKMCRKCLDYHRGRCSVSVPCGVNNCSVQHHALLHVDDGSFDSPNSGHNDGALLKYVPVVLHGPGGRVETYAFLDDGSTSTFMDHDLLSELGITGTPHPLHLQWTGGVRKEEKDSVRVSVRISGRDETATEHELLNVHTVQELALPAQTVNVAQLAANYAHLRRLPLTTYNQAVPRVLIGINNCNLTRPLKSKQGKCDEPIASKTRLGWVIYGPCLVAITTPGRSFHVSVCDGSSDDRLSATTLQSKDNERDDYYETQLKRYRKLSTQKGRNTQPKGISGKLVLRGTITNASHKTVPGEKTFRALRIDGPLALQLLNGHPRGPAPPVHAIPDPAVPPDRRSHRRRARATCRAPHPHSLPDAYVLRAVGERSIACAISGGSGGDDSPCTHAHIAHRAPVESDVLPHLPCTHPHIAHRAPIHGQEGSERVNRFRERHRSTVNLPALFQSSADDNTPSRAATSGCSSDGESSDGEERGGGLSPAERAAASAAESSSR